MNVLTGIHLYLLLTFFGLIYVYNAPAISIKTYSVRVVVPSKTRQVRQSLRSCLGIFVQSNGMAKQTLAMIFFYLLVHSKCDPYLLLKIWFYDVVVNQIVLYYPTIYHTLSKDFVLSCL